MNKLLLVDIPKLISEDNIGELKLIALLNETNLLNVVCILLLFKKDPMILGIPVDVESYKLKWYEEDNEDKIDSHLYLHSLVCRLDDEDFEIERCLLHDIIYHGRDSDEYITFMSYLVLDILYIISEMNDIHIANTIQYVRSVYKILNLYKKRILPVIPRILVYFIRQLHVEGELLCLSLLPDYYQEYTTKMRLEVFTLLFKHK